MPALVSKLLRHRLSRAFLRALSVTLAGALLGNSMAVASAPLDAARVKEKLIKRGIGKGVKIKEADGRELAGVLTGIRDDEFDVTPKGSLQPTTVIYSHVVAVHNDGSSVAKKVGTGVAIGAGVYIGIVLVALVVVIAVAAK